MKKILLTITFLLLSIGLTGCGNGEEIDDVLQTYCDTNPEDAFCSPGITSDADVAKAIYDDINDDILNGFNGLVCEEFFANPSLVEQCNQNVDSMFPDDYDELSDDFVVYDVKGQSTFEVYTTYSNGDNAYTFTIVVAQTDNGLFLTQFSYAETEDDFTPGDNTPDDKEPHDEEPDDAVIPDGLTELDVKFFMRDIIMYVDVVCADYFTSTALVECNGGLGNIRAFGTGMDNSVTFNDNGTVTYYGNTSDDTASAIYTISFVKESDILKATSISYSLIGELTYNPDATQGNDTDDLDLSNQDVIDLMDHVINGLSVTCGDHFTGEALTNCNDDLDNVRLYARSSNPTITFINDSTVTYYVEASNGSDSVTYNLEFVKVSGAVLISNLTYIYQKMNVTSLTNENVDQFLKNYYMALETTSLNCADWYSDTVSSTTVTGYNRCETNPTSIIPMNGWDELTFYYTANFEKVYLVLYQENATDDYTQVYPSSEFELIVENSQIKIKDHTVNLTDSITTFETILNVFLLDFINLDKDVCIFYPSLYQETDFNSCDTWQNQVQSEANPTWRHYHTMDANDNWKYFIEITTDSMIRTYEVNFLSKDGYYEMLTLWEVDD